MDDTSYPALENYNDVSILCYEFRCVGKLHETKIMHNY